jgi:hypothetical protein
MLTMGDSPPPLTLQEKRGGPKPGRAIGFIARRQGAGIVQSFLDRIAIGPRRFIRISRLGKNCLLDRA